MTLFAHEFNNLNDLLAQQLHDLYDAEQRLIKALPKMSEAASSPDLRMAFQTHLRETEEHAWRLEEIFKILGLEPERESCKAMQGLVQEGEDMIKAKGDDVVRDAGLIAAAQRVEHYEMAGYGTVRAFAERLGHDEVARLLQKTLDEEGQADKMLTAIAETQVNPRSLH